MSNYANRESILLLANSLQIEAISIEGSAPIYIRGMSAKERDSFESSCMQGKGKTRQVNLENIRARLLTRSICNPSGERLFQDSDSDLLGTIPASIADKLFSASQKLSGLSSGDVEELAGN